MMRSRACCTFFCESSSNADVASSRISICGFLMIALAMAILCFCPPDSFPPLSPQSISYPWCRSMSMRLLSLLSVSPLTV
mmetsp:Transcript_46416/g.34089  ORF Transcript_46416/g.34089 Transcript_46416/m.34089 type:complete len:80 (-) Transcript_46416:298-537(-)